MKVCAGKGKYSVELQLIPCEEGAAVVLTGGEKTHIGAVVLAVPRQSLTGDGLSCDSYVMPVPGHKDHIVALSVAEKLCRLLGAPVSVSAGIHIENASKDELGILQKNCQDVLSLIVAQLEKDRYIKE
jgi:hypothetical protein